jgi:hypothetical protein
MKKTTTSLFSNLFGFKKEPTTIPIVLNQYSQPHVLQQRMKEAKLTHGETVKGDIGPVRLESHFSKMNLYFCAAQEVTINERITPGDGGAIPSDAILKGFDELVPKTKKPGLYMLKNATFFSNGTMQVIADKDTVFEAI